MICNKKEWAILDDIQATLFKFWKMMDDRDKERVNAFIYLCAESTKAEKERNAKSSQTIKERRKEDPDYARPAKERKREKVQALTVRETPVDTLVDAHSTKTSEIKIGDKVRYIAEGSIENKESGFYPPKGTIGTVIWSGSDSIVCQVKWPEETTKWNGRWYVEKKSVELV